MASDFWCVLAWGGAATIASVIGIIQARVVPRCRRHGSGCPRTRPRFRYMVEGTTNSVSSQLRTYGIGLLMGLAAVGYVQAANT